jgi:hypothetical protein
MTTKTNGAEFKRFYTDETFWSADVYHDDSIITVNGMAVEDSEDLEKIDDAVIVTVEGGIVYGVKGEPSFESFFKKWRKLQRTASFVVECDKSVVEAIKTAIKQAGGVVK